MRQYLLQTLQVIYPNIDEDLPFLVLLFLLLSIIIVSVVMYFYLFPTLV